MQSPKTCVILVNYNGADDTAACVRSLLQSTVPVEIIVVDTTPHDPELEASLSFAPGTVILRAVENLGFGRANNLGIQHAANQSDCEFVFILNNDTTVSGDSVETLERAMNAQRDVGIMVPRIAFLHDPGVLWYGGGEVDWRRASAFTPGMNGSTTAALAMKERNVTFATGCALFFRRNALTQLVGFDPRFFMYEEDVELCLRASRRGIRIRYLPSSFILHRTQGSSKDSDHDRTNFFSARNPGLPFLCYNVIRNRLLNVYQYARGKNLLLVMCFFPLFLIRRAGPFLRAGRLDAVFAMFRGIAGFWTARRPMPPSEWPLEIEKDAQTICSKVS